MADYTLDDVQRMGASDTGKTYSLNDVAAMREPEPAESRRPVQVPGIPGMMFSTALGLMQPEGRAEVGRASLGAVRGAADIGSTLLRGGAWLADKVAPGVAEADRERRQSLDQFFDERVSPNDPAFMIGRVASNLAGTAGVGPALAAPLRGLAAASPAATAVINAVGSGGMSTGVPALGRAADLGIRTVGGAVTGGASAALVDPDSAGTGALIGGALPGGLQAAGQVASATGRGLRTLRTPADARMAREVAAMAGADGTSLDDLAAVRDALRPQGPEMINGARPTVPQLLQTPELSQLQRSVKTVSPATLANHEAAQNAARFEALNRVAPVTGTVQQAAQDAGNTIADWAGPERVRAGQRVNQLFDAVDPLDQTRFRIPVDAMRDAQARFLGPGTFGSGRSARTAVETAEAIGTRPAPPGSLAADLERIPRPVPFREIQNLRSSVGEAAQAADAKGFAREAAALNGMKREIDARVAAVSRGEGMPGEAFPADTVASWQNALNAHQFKKLQFDTGPQRSMFRLGGDGQASIQGAEIPGKFFNASRSQVEDAQAFRRLVGTNPGLLDDLRRYAVTDASGQVDRLGNLTSTKFNRWLDARSGATGVIFDEQQRAMLKAVADDLRRAERAESLGRVTGSDTAQKAAGMLRLGLLDSPGANFAAGKVPGGTALLDFLRGQVRSSRADRLSGLLVDPERTAGLLDSFIAAHRPSATQGMLSEAVDPLLTRSAPVLLSGRDR